jgi:hypothetical protein
MGSYARFFGVSLSYLFPPLAQRREGGWTRIEKTCFGYRSSSLSKRVRGERARRHFIDSPRAPRKRRLRQELMQDPNRPFPAVRFSRLSAVSGSRLFESSYGLFTGLNLRHCIAFEVSMLYHKSWGSMIREKNLAGSVISSFSGRVLYLRFPYQDPKLLIPRPTPQCMPSAIDYSTWIQCSADLLTFHFSLLFES